MQFYPAILGSRLKEVWHGTKMLKDVPDHRLSPTIRHNGKIYYVNELMECTDQRWFIPTHWLCKGQGFVALGHHAWLTDLGLVVEQDKTDFLDTRNS